MKKIKRRQMLKALGTGVLATSLASPALVSPALAQEKKIKWKMVTSWPKNLPGPGVAAQILADRITRLSGGRIEVTLYAVGEIVPGNGVFDAVSQGVAEIYHSVPAYWGSKSKGILLFGSQPFGLTAPEQIGWMIHGGGQELYDEMYSRFNLKPFLCGNSGPQWGGWFRNEITSPDDLKGLKFRSTGLASEMCAKLGMAVEAMSGPAMFQALQSGALDAGEFIGPWTDSALGYYQVAKNYYWPGVGEPSSAEECAVNIDAFNELSDDLKEVVRLAAQSLYNPVLTEYMTKHAKALIEMVEGEAQVKVRKFPDSVLKAMRVAADEVINELENDGDELVVRITKSFITYRDLMKDYMIYADNGQMNARVGV